MDSSRAECAERPPRLTAWRLHDVSFTVRFDPGLDADPLGPVFAALPFRLDSSPAGAADFSIEVRQGPEPAPAPIPGGASRISFGLRIESDGHRLLVTDGHSWFSVDLDDRSGVMALHPGFSTLSAKAQLDLFLIGFNELLASLNHFDLHGAALTHNGAGVLLVGGTRTGKSTAALALVAAGWRYVSDDALILSTETPVRVRSFRRPFNVDPELARHYSGIAAHFRGEEGEDGKRFLDVDRAFPGQFADACVPSHLIFTRLSGEGTTSVERLEPAEAMARLVRQSPSLAFRGRHARPHLDALARLVRQTRPFLLSAGRDARDRPDLLHERLTEVL